MDNNSDGSLDVYRPVVHKLRADLAFLAAIGILFVTATPIGLPTHMLDYGPGGYRFSDFIRIGLLISSSWQPTSLS